MRTPFAKFLCTFIALTLLLVPAAALAEDGQPAVAIDISGGKRTAVAVHAAGLDTSDLYLNGIPFQARLSAKGGIYVYTKDLASASAVADALRTSNNSEWSQVSGFVSRAGLRIVAGQGIEIGQSALLPDRDIANKVIPTEWEAMDKIRKDFAVDLLANLKAFNETLNRVLVSKDNKWSNRVRQITTDLITNDRVFLAGLKELYLLLFDIRAAIAKGDLVHELLYDVEITKLLNTYRNILSALGLDLKQLAFWNNELAWAFWRANNIETRVSPGTVFSLSDGTGKTLNINVRSVAPADPKPKTMPLTIECDKLIDVADITVTLALDGKANIEFMIIEGPEGAEDYVWTQASLPEGLALETGKDSSYARITGTPTDITDAVGVDVTVSASTTVEGQDYEGRCSFKLVVESVD